MPALRWAAVPAVAGVLTVSVAVAVAAANEPALPPTPTPTACRYLGARSDAGAHAAQSDAGADGDAGAHAARSDADAGAHAGPADPTGPARDGLGGQHHDGQYGQYRHDGHDDDREHQLDQHDVDERGRERVAARWCERQGRARALRHIPERLRPHCASFPRRTARARSVRTRPARAERATGRARER